MKQIKILEIILMLLLIVFIFSYCNKQNPVSNIDSISKSGYLLKKSVSSCTIGDKIEQWSNLLEVVKGLAICLENEGLRALLETSISNSANPENKVDFREFLFTHFSKNIIVLDAIAEKIDSTPKELVNTLKNISTDIDMYFPVDEHRNNWVNKKEILVAIPLYDSKGEIESIIGFDTFGNGNILDKSKSPQIPTLVIYPSEIRKNNDLALTDNYSKIIAKESGQGKKESPKAVQLRNIVIDEFLISVDYDDYWWLGNMEIEFRLKDDYDNYVLRPNNGNLMKSNFDNCIVDTREVTWWCYSQWGTPTDFWLDKFYLYHEYRWGTVIPGYARLDIEVWEIDEGEGSDNDFVSIVRDIDVNDSGSYHATGGLDLTIRVVGLGQSDLQPLPGPSWYCVGPSPK